MDTDKSTLKFQKELNSGAISLVLLGVMKQSGEPMYGYEIAKLLEGLGDDGLPMNQGAIYPVLRSLERQGLLRSKKVPSEVGPPRKYYQVTAAGDRAFENRRETWSAMVSFVNSFLEPANAKVKPSRDHAIPSRAGKRNQAAKRRRS